MRHGWSTRAGLCALFLLLLAAPARAGTTYVSQGVLHYDATAGEQDDLVLTAVPDGGGGALRILGTGTPGAGCTLWQAGQVQCTSAGITRVDVKLGDQDDHFRFYDGVTLPVSIDGGTGNDTLEAGSTGPESLSGGEGNDAIRVDRNEAGTADVFSGGPGEDSISFGDARAPQSVTLDGVANDGAPGDGDDVRPDFETIRGSDYADHIVGTGASETFYGGDGADVIEGGGGDDTLDGEGHCADDRLLGGPGKDTLILRGRTYADGGPDDDAIRVGGAACGSYDEVFGGTGTDTADFTGEWHPGVEISLNDKADDGPHLYADLQNFHSDIEVLEAGDAGMLLIGGPGPNTLIGGAGDDLLDGAGGTDVLIGAGGYDVADYTSHDAGVTLSLDGVANDGAPGENENLGADIEDLRGGPANDSLTGDDHDNVLDGGGGADTLSGGGGIDAVDYSSRRQNVSVDLDGQQWDDGEYGELDTVGADVEGAFGGDGQDLLVGNAADGYLFGGDGDDYLIDRGGEDELDGGWGDDTIDSADERADTVDCGFGADAAWRDQTDAMTGCETTSNGPRPVPVPFGPQTLTIGTNRPPTAPRLPISRPPRPDRTAPKAAVLTVKGRMRALSVTVRCNEACALSARLVRGNGNSLAKGSVPALAATERTLRLKLTAAGKRRLKDGRYRLELTLTDGAGNARLIERSLKLRR